ncbi:MAG: hypothetical protein ACPG1Z_09905 [Planctomycetota bacterium]
MKNLCRKSLVLLSIVFLSNPLSLVLLWLLNRLFLRPFRSFFVVYPASQRYADHYGFKFLQPALKKTPVICGVYFQGGTPGLILGISGTESDFKKPGFLSNLKKKSDQIARWLGISSVKYSGILPSSMHRAGVLEPLELKRRSSRVAQVVFRAEKELRQQLSIETETPVILLGGHGSVGTPLQRLLQAQGRSVYTVDCDDPIPESLRGERVILIDVARKGALEVRMPQLWQGIIILNETYPAPRKRTLQKLEELTIPVFHIAGVKGIAIPHFPGAYSGAIPCCGMNDSDDNQPLLKYLSSEILRKKLAQQNQNNISSIAA